MKRTIVEYSFSIDAMVERKQLGRAVNPHPNFHKIFKAFAESDCAKEIDRELGLKRRRK